MTCGVSSDMTPQGGVLPIKKSAKNDLNSGGWIFCHAPRFQEFSNIPLEHTKTTPNKQFMFRNSFHLGLKGDTWGMVQGYVGVLLDR